MDTVNGVWIKVQKVQILCIGCAKLCLMSGRPRARVRGGWGVRGSFFPHVGTRSICVESATGGR